MTEKDPFLLQDFLPYMLNQAAERTGLEFQRYYKDRYGMLRTEWRVLFHLGHYGALTAKEICSRANLHKTKVSRAVAALEKRRFLVRAPREDDRRHEMLDLTRNGQAAFDDLVAEAARYNARLLQPFSRQEAETLHHILRRIARPPSG